MKRLLVVLVVLVIAAMSVMAVSADQNGNSHYCTVDSYGCWVTGENGGHDYIMFWSEAAREFIMGPGSNAPLGILPEESGMSMDAPLVEVVKEEKEEEQKEQKQEEQKEQKQEEQKQEEQKEQKQEEQKQEEQKQEE